MRIAVEYFVDIAFFNFRIMTFVFQNSFGDRYNVRQTFNGIDNKNVLSEREIE